MNARNRSSPRGLTVRPRVRLAAPGRDRVLRTAVGRRGVPELLHPLLDAAAGAIGRSQLRGLVQPRHWADHRRHRDKRVQGGDRGRDGGIWHQAYRLLLRARRASAPAARMSGLLRRLTGCTVQRVPWFAKSDFFAKPLDTAGINALLHGIEALARVRGAAGHRLDLARVGVRPGQPVQVDDVVLRLAPSARQRPGLSELHRRRPEGLAEPLLGHQLPADAGRQDHLRQEEAVQLSAGDPAAHEVKPRRPWLLGPGQRSIRRS